MACLQMIKHQFHTMLSALFGGDSIDPSKHKFCNPLAGHLNFDGHTSKIVPLK